PGDRDLIRDRQQRLLDEQRKRLEELQQLPGKGAPAAGGASGDDERCFEIRRIELEGASSWRRALSPRCPAPSSWMGGISKQRSSSPEASAAAGDALPG
ncbi:hypothetical protein ACV33H_34310, partial [Pseudomonas aeruginosa]